MTEPGTSVRRPGGRRLSERGRVEAFSDGVLAIALTLLVLDLHSEAPRGGFAHALSSQWPGYVAYLAAFLNIASIWVNHHDLFDRVRQVDVRLVCLNLFILLVASLFPWPAAVIASAVRDGTHADEVTAAILYAGVGLLVPLAFAALYAYLARVPTLLEDGQALDYVRAGLRRTRLSLVVYPVAAVVALVSPAAALGLFVAVPAVYIAALFTGD